MCGIIGYIGKQKAASILIEGLKRLEYRGYDSAGLSVISREFGVETIKAVGKVANLENKINGRDIGGTAGIAHTRWRRMANLAIKIPIRIPIAGKIFFWCITALLKIIKN